MAAILIVTPHSEKVSSEVVPGTNDPDTSQSIATTENPQPSDMPVPTALIDTYVRMALRRAIAEQMEDGRWFVSIPILGDVWADGDTLEEADDALDDVTRQWVDMKIEDGDRDLPVLGSLDLNVL